MPAKMRLLHVLMQPVVVDDDGESLLPGPVVQAVQLSLADAVKFLETLPERLREADEERQAAESTPSSGPAPDDDEG